MQERALETIPGSVKGTIPLPRFSKSLLLRDLSVDTSEPSSALLEVSCSYDLASSLRLLPGQENEEFAEYDEIPVDRAVSRGQCYCGRISHHGLLFLISRHLQDITTVETASGGSSIVIQTTFGRFKFYEQNEKSFVHFDRGTPSSNVDLVLNQKLEDILKAASGQYLVNKSIFNTNFVWQRCSGDLQVEDLATKQLFGIPDAVIYMKRSVLENWNRLERFSYAMLDAMKSVLDELDDLEVPSSILEALKKLPNWRRSIAEHGGLPLVDFSAEPADSLAYSVYVIDFLSHKMLEDLSVNGGLKYSLIFFSVY